MTHWLSRIVELVARHGGAARVVIIAASGPTPREIGTAMLVTRVGTEGRIGRGQTEDIAVAAARRLIEDARQNEGQSGWLRVVHDHAGGHVLGAPSGGATTLLIEAFGPTEANILEAVLRDQVGTGAHLAGEPLVARPIASGRAIEIVHTDQSPDRALPGSAAIPLEVPAQVRAALARFGRDRRARLDIVDGRGTAYRGAAANAQWVIERLIPRGVPFHLYGTGLAARALVKALDGLPFEVVWVDTDPARFEPSPPGHVRPLAVPDMALVASEAPDGAFHAVMTRAHDLDHEICRALLRSGRFGYAGVIGSALKRERLHARLLTEGFVAADIARLTCPIGLPGIRSKQPAVMAISVAAQALIALEGGQNGAAVHQAAGTKL